eukprot:gene30283-43393_t
MDIYANTVHRAIKAKCLGVWARMLHYAPADALVEQLRGVPVSSFIAQLLHSGDGVAAATGIHVAGVLMTKLPAGVLTEVRRVVDGPPPPAGDGGVAALVRAECGRFVEQHFAAPGE